MVAEFDCLEASLFLDWRACVLNYTATAFMNRAVRG